MERLPTGLVTFLFTDMEGSTRMWEEATEEMKAAHTRRRFMPRPSSTAAATRCLSDCADGRDLGHPHGQHVTDVGG